MKEQAEIRLIVSSREDDPARFSIKLHQPLDLDDSWRLALLEIIVPSQVSFLQAEQDVIRIKKSVPTPSPDESSPHSASREGSPHPTLGESDALLGDKLLEDSSQPLGNTEVDRRTLASEDSTDTHDRPRLTYP